MSLAAVVEIGSTAVGGGNPLLIIAGPCAAESVDLCLKVGAEIQASCAAAGLSYVFKASLDKANRTGLAAGRGPGLDRGLEILARVKRELGVPVLTDIHESGQAAALAEVCDCLQIPAFLSRQTDLITAAAASGRPLHIKKGQFLAPEEAVAVAAKARALGAAGVILCERGTTFGYHNLVVDMRALVAMRAAACPVVFDATHSTQLPGAAGTASGGNRRMALPLARAAVAVGVDGLFLEAHVDPTVAVSDAACQLALPVASDLIGHLGELHRIVRAQPHQGRPEDMLDN